VLYEPSPERLDTSQQAVMGIGERKQREKGEYRPATHATTPSNLNPVVVFIVGLLETAAVTDNGIAATRRASAQQLVLAVFLPVAFHLA
jgi:hypothetical protein